MVQQSLAQQALQQSRPSIRIGRELKTELIRKSIHLLIATVPLLAATISAFPTLILLAAGTIIYTYAEIVRGRGGHIPIISRLTELASRKRDKGHFVVGPVTLGIGAMLALMLYPEPAASIAIYALAFGDGIASMVGKLFGRLNLPLTRGKTAEGSLACLLAVFLTTFLLLADYVSSVWVAAGIGLAIAVAASLIEAMPLDDLDNLALPAGVGLTAHLLIAALVV